MPFHQAIFAPRSLTTLAALAMSALAIGCDSPLPTSTTAALTEEWSGSLPSDLSLESVVALPNDGFVASGWSNSGARFVARVSPSGSMEWIDGTMNSDGWEVAGDGADHVYVTGVFWDAAELFGVKVEASTYPARFLAKVTTDGSAAWTKVFDEGNTNQVSELAANADGVALAGRYSVGLTIDDVSLIPGQPGGGGAFVLRLDADGNVTAARSYGSSSSQFHSVALAPDGDLFVGGNFYGVLNLGSGPMATSNGANFFGRLDSAGEARWSRHFAGEGFIDVTAWDDGLAVLARGSLIDLGVGRWLTGQVAARVEADGEVAWARQLGSFVAYGGAQQGAVSTSGHLLVGRSNEPPSEGTYYPNAPDPNAITRDLIALDREGQLAAELEFGPLNGDSYGQRLMLDAGVNAQVLLGRSEVSYSPSNEGPSYTNRLQRLRLVNQEK